MKFEPPTLLVMTVLLVVAGCGQTGALYLPSDAPEQSADAPQTTSDTTEEADSDEDPPASTDNTP